jgi:hypothetical protein
MTQQLFTMWSVRGWDMLMIRNHPLFPMWYYLGWAIALCYKYSV